MEGNISIVKTNHPGFGEYFSSNVVEVTRMRPKQRIANLASGFANPTTRGKIRELLLCDRFCCKVRPLYHHGEFMSNKNLISECLTDLSLFDPQEGFFDLQNTRKNTVELLHSMFYDENESIRNMAMDILKDALSSSKSSYIYQYDAFDAKIDEMVNKLSPEEKSSISKNKANGLLRNIEGLFSEKNIKKFLRNKKNVKNVLLQLFENEFVDQGINKDLKIKAVDFIERLFSEKYINETMKGKDLTDFISSELKKSLESKLQVEKIADIIKDLFSKKSVNGIFTDKDFLQKILNPVKSLFINVSDDNKDLKEKVMAIVKELFSGENIDSMFKKDFDERVAGSGWGHIHLMGTLVDILSEMLKNECLRKKANEIIRKLFFGENIDAISRDNHFPLGFENRLFEILKDKQLDKGSKDAAYGILKDLFSGENISILFKNGEHGKVAHAFEPTFQRILKSSIKGVSYDKELEGEVRSLIELLVKNKNINGSFKKEIEKEFKSVLPHGDEPAIEKSSTNGTVDTHILGRKHRKSDKKNTGSDKNIENAVKEKKEK